MKINRVYDEDDEMIVLISVCILYPVYSLKSAFYEQMILQGRCMSLQFAMILGVFHGSAHLPAYQLYPFEKPTHMYFSILQQSHTTNISPSKTTNDQKSQKISTDYTENVDIEYQNKLPE